MPLDNLVQAESILLDSLSALDTAIALIPQDNDLKPMLSVLMNHFSDEYANYFDLLKEHFQPPAGKPEPLKVAH